MTPERFFSGLLGALVLALGGIAPAAAQPPADKPRVNADAALSVEFLKRVQEYVDLHEKLEKTLPPRQDQATPAGTEGHEQALARLLVQARARARQGDIFTSDVRAYFRRQIGRALAGPDGREIRQAIMEDNPGKVQLRVNSRYPDSIPLTTMPPSVLGALPKLPAHIEYRFIGRRLVLLDIHSQLVVDYMDQALPA